MTTPPGAAARRTVFCVRADATVMAARLVLVLALCALDAGLLGAAAGLRGKAGFLTGEIVSMVECKDHPVNNVIFSPNATLYRGPGGEFALYSGSFDVFKTTNTITKGTIAFDYCAQGVAKTCQNFSNWRFGPGEGCGLWVNKNTIWRHFAAAISPPFLCPLKKGHYTMTNMTLDVTRLELLPVENREWRVSLVVYGDDEKPWTCASITCKFYRAGRRKGSRT